MSRRRVPRQQPPVCVVSAGLLLGAAYASVVPLGTVSAALGIAGVPPLLSWGTGLPTHQLTGGIQGLPPTAHHAEPSSPIMVRREPPEPEWRWVSDHRAELRQYAGQWIVVEGQRLVAHHRNAMEAVRAARAQGVKHPLLYHVEGERLARTGYLGL